MATSTTAKPAPKGLYGVDLVNYISGAAKQLNIDPAAVLAVAQSEGGFSGAVGDQGTSFGPFQLHQGGKLPASVQAQGLTAEKAFGNSPAGINYALQGIAGVATGTTGTDTVSKIVTNFEQPLNPGAEVQTASGYYPDWKNLLNLQSQGGQLYNNSLTGYLGHFESGVTGAPNAVANEATNIANTVTAPITSAEGLIAWVTDIHHWEMLAGGILILTGIVMLGRSASSSKPAKQVQGAASTVAAPVQSRSRPASAPTTSRQNTGPPLSQTSARRRREAGFTLPADRKPKRGQAGSSRRARGERIPF